MAFNEAEKLHVVQSADQIADLEIQPTGRPVGGSGHPEHGRSRKKKNGTRAGKGGVQTNLHLHLFKPIFSLVQGPILVTLLSKHIDPK